MMRKQSGKATNNYKEKSKGSSNKVLNSQEQSRNQQPSRTEHKISAFEVQPLELAKENNSSNIRQIVREEVEKFGVSNNGFLKTDRPRLKHSLDLEASVFGSGTGLQAYIKARLEHASDDSRFRYQQIKSTIQQVDHRLSERINNLQQNLQSFERVLERQSSLKRLGPQNRLSVVESKVQFLMDRIEGLSSTPVVQENYSVSMSFLKEIRQNMTPDWILSKEQTKLEIGQLSDTLYTLQEEVDRLDREIKKKANKAQTNQIIEEINSKLQQQSTTLDRLHYLSQTSHSDMDQMSLRASNLEQEISRIAISLDTKIQMFRKNSQIEVEENRQELTTRLGKIITSYNLNFEQIDLNLSEMREMLGETLKINGVISGKLIGIVRQRLQSSDLNLNQHLQEELSHNNRKIQEMRDKEFQVENELLCLKQMLQSMRKDYTRHQRKTQRQDDDVNGHSARKPSESLRGSISPCQPRRSLLKSRLNTSGQSQQSRQQSNIMNVRNSFFFQPQRLSEELALLEYQQ